METRQKSSGLRPFVEDESVAFGACDDPNPKEAKGNCPPASMEDWDLSHHSPFLASEVV